LLKSKEKVSGEMAIVFTVYNLRRVMFILGIKETIEALKSAETAFFVLWRSLEAPVRADRRSGLWRVGVNVREGLAQVKARA